MKRWILALAAGVVLSWGMSAFAEDTSGPHRFGIGAHYWKALKDIDVKDVDEDGFSWVATYQYKPGTFGLGLDVEWKEKGFAGSAEDVYEPQAYVILGRALYAAAGVGGYYSDGEFADDPFYLFRAGFDVELLPSIRLDIHAIYRFEKWNDLESSATDADSDTITLGAAIRIAL